MGHANKQTNFKYINIQILLGFLEDLVLPLHYLVEELEEQMGQSAGSPW